ncbi:MAG: DUF63 family protein [Candidatus Anstonellaceae archaeon]
MQELVQKYFIDPIWQRSGYNTINTLTYAAIALVSLYLIWRFMKSKKFDFSSREFLLSVAAFVLFGSTARVVTDLSDAGAITAAALQGGFLGGIYSALDSSGIFHYGYFTVTPGIYVVTAALLLLSIAVGRLANKPMLPAYAGFVLWLPCFLLIVPFMSQFTYVALAIALAAAGSYTAYFLLERVGGHTLDLHGKLAVAGQAFDGAATFVILDVFGPAIGKGYFEQHVLSGGIGTATPLGYFLFFLVKVSLAALIVHFVGKERMDDSDRALVLIVVAIMGFAPGIRDALRMLAGT